MLDGPTRALLYDMHWRPQSRDYRRLWIGLLVTLLLHALFFFVVWHEMRPRPLPALAYVHRREDALQVRLIETPPPAPAQAPSPPPAPPPQAIAKAPAPTPAKHPPPRPRPVREATEPDAMKITMQGSEPAPAPAASVTLPPAPAQLFGKDGQVALPANATKPPPAPTPDYVQRPPEDTAGIMQHKSPITYKPTRFEHQPPGADNGEKRSSVDDSLQDLHDSTTKTHTFNGPMGMHIHCSVSLIPPGGGCGGDPPPPPSKKDGDERLSMAPAAPLAKDPNPQPPPPSEAECIKIYRADKPLPYGCPVDTPNRAVDAELRERAAKGN